MDPHNVNIDVTFFKHLVDCLRKQRTILNESPEIRISWRGLIDLTIDQCDSIIKERDEAIREATATWMLGVTDELYSEDVLYSEDD